MSTNSIPRDDQFSQILRNLSDFYGNENLKLIELLRSKGVTMREIAKALDVVPSALHNRFARKEKRS
jgi:hypothetical protein